MSRLHVPIAGWLPTYEKRWLSGDAIAGLTVWALAVPEAMAYAAIAGVPVQYGLYAIPLAIVGYTVFGTSRRLVIGPSSTIAALTAATVAPLAVAMSDEYVALVAVLALLVGLLFVVLGLLRMGWISHFFAKPVLDGFIVGLGLFIAIGQMNKLVGIEKPDGNSLRQLWGVITDIGEWEWTTVAVGAGALAVLFLLPKLLPKIPGALVVLVAGIAVSSALNLRDHGVAVVGAVPTGYDFVAWSGVTFHDVVDMVPGALGIVVVAFAQSLAIAKAYARKDGAEVDANGELIAYGAATIGAGVLQGPPPAGSLSKTAAACESGGRTPLAFVMTAAFIVVTTLFLAGVFEQLPEAVLGAIVIHAVWEMIDPAKLTRLSKAHLPDFWLALGALAGVLLIGILAGVVVGVVLSLVLLIHRLDHPRIARLGRRPDNSFSDVTHDPLAVAVPGIEIFRVEAPLIFANADVIIEALRAGLDAAGPGVTTVVLDFEAVYEIDTEGVDVLAQLVGELAARHVRLVIARAHASVRGYLERDASFDAIGADNIVPTINDAVNATA